MKKICQVASVSLPCFDSWRSPLNCSASLYLSVNILRSYAHNSEYFATMSIYYTGGLQFYSQSRNSIEGSKLACDTGGHFTNYPTWPLPRTNPNVDVLNNSLNYHALADLMLYRLSVNMKHITLFTDVLAVTLHIIKRPELITCCHWRIFRVVGVAAVYLHNSSSDMVNIF